LKKNLKKNMFIIFTVIVFSVFAYFAFQKFQIEKTIVSKISKINILDTDIKNIEQKIGKVQGRISKYQIMGKKLFGNGHEAEELYNLLSQIALNNQLLIENISKGKIKNFLRKDIFPSKENSKREQENSDEIIFSKVIVDYSITGKYEDYMAFRRLLADEKSVIGVESEKITVDDSKNSTNIEVELELTTYRMGNFDYAKI
jgi:Tfp pilus assembly protein PilO